MNRSEENKPAQNADGQKNEEQFAEANKVSTIEEDNERRPLDKTEGNTQNGELGGSMTEEEHKK